MANEYNRDPWTKTNVYIDRTYPSGAAGARPAFTTRFHCEPDDPDTDVRGSESDNRCAEFNRQLRAGHAERNRGDE